MSSRSRTLLLAFALLGLGASIISSYVHYQLLTEPGYNSFCDVNATVSCTDAYLSRYGSFMGVPVAIGGVIFFAIAAVLAGIAGSARSSARENAAGYIFMLSTIGLAFALYLAWASYLVLGVFCILCAITYVSVIALFVISGGATTFPMTSLPGRAARDVRTLISSPVPLVMLLVIGAGSGALIASFPDERQAVAAQAEAVANFQPLAPEERKQLEAWWAVQPQVELPIPPADGTKVLIVKFSDYQCPACKGTHESLKPVLAKYQGQGVQFVMKHYPLEPECNPSTPNMNHFGSCEAAAAYEMAKSTPHLARLDDWLFDHQQTLTKDVVRQAALEQAGIKDFDARYDAALQTVRTDASLGALVKVTGTPTVFINGRRIPCCQPPAVFDAFIDIALKAPPAK
ncbi:MAG TPA: vitamin K epoxide reductase family protein [Vicinamibacterales bacterium]|nr:vitamin K epoxide reductase family protein [Vicinamibacterales bacterium]